MKKFAAATKVALVGAALAATLTPVAAAAGTPSTSSSAPAPAAQEAQDSQAAAVPCGLHRIPTHIPPGVFIRWFYHNCTGMKQNVSAKFAQDGRVEVHCLPPGEHFIGGTPVLSDVWLTRPEGPGNVC